MTFSLSKPVKIALTCSLLAACSQPANYAPVKTVNQTFTPDNGYLPPVVPHTPKSSQVIPKPRTPVSQKSTHKLNQTHPAENKRNQDVSVTPTAPQPSPKPGLPTPVTTAKTINNNPSDKKHTTIVEQKPLPTTPDLAKQTKNNEKISSQQPQKISESLNKNSDNKNISQKNTKTLDKLQIAEKNNAEEKKSIISIDNKKMLKLNFQWPLQGKIYKTFPQTDNKGIEIAGKGGQSVQAAEAGKAVYCGNGMAGFGNLAIIKHNETYLSAYANNSKLMIKEGQRVTKGQTIGQIGSSGFKKAALHFEIRKNGKPVNPLTLLPKH